MFNRLKQSKSREDKLYNKILSLSRNKLFYRELAFCDTFQNRINLIFLHISFLFIKVKQRNNNNSYHKFYQRMFDYIFRKIEIDMREIGYSDTTVNKNMKFLVKIFYNILLNCEDYEKKTFDKKSLFLFKYLDINKVHKHNKSINIIEYFNQYHSFCLDLSTNNVLKGNLNFSYK
tara:strand:- start:167 stop:691 length:525 start_codon:yes stop_codon:yes gene_type:complete